MPYLDNYWSDSFGPKCDPPVFGVLHLPKYFGNLSNFISHTIPKFQKTSVIHRGNTTSISPSARIRPRTYPVIFQFVPCNGPFDPYVPEHLRELERENDLKANTISSATWCKRPEKRSPGQTSATLRVQCSDPQTANYLLKEHIRVADHLVSVHKDIKQPLRCVLCQQYGHFKDACINTEKCAICASEFHSSSSCINPNKPCCVSCQRGSNHLSSSPSCPTFIQKCKTLDTKLPKNAMPYFPTNERWTWVMNLSNPERPPSPLPSFNPSTSELPHIRTPPRSRSASRSPPPPFLPNPPLSLVHIRHIRIHINNTNHLICHLRRNLHICPAPASCVSRTMAGLQTEFKPHSPVSGALSALPLPLLLNNKTPQTPIIVLVMSKRPPSLPSKLRIWQQNLHKSQTAQDYVRNTANPADWDILALQEPWLNSLGNSRGTQYWQVIYPANFYAEGSSCIHSILLINTNISTDSYTILPIQNSDVTAVRFKGEFGHLTVFNIYNEITNNNTILCLDNFLVANPLSVRPNAFDHMIWLGDFNRHHPIWEDKSNERLFESEDFINPLLELLYNHDMILALPKGIPTFQTCTGNWTRPNNVWRSNSPDT